ncbi:hypothetical protein [Roseivirga sp. UBA1976]|jgi:hypothetical protein|uniref:hypothetical protein n=1 Tax=Roseivirga sp. UBA1976 TaxID=1947386 RepID=UPI00257D7BC3|nr:hypothetical protein [Roseivirga sp. UBA1976]MEC7755611.1 hypothetical protein [Bacteroidota bacterium]|tara:strand:- start:6558 stop:7679 length:1122 start_codon:yes stop_codon:yes gene_type:complete
MLKEYLRPCSTVADDDSVQTIEFVRSRLKPIAISSETFKTKAKYSLLEEGDEILLLETGEHTSKYTLFNLSKGEVIAKGEIDGPPLNIGVTSFFDYDSIYFNTGLKGKIYRMDTSGIIKEEINLSNLSASWFLEGSLPSLLENHDQGKIEIIDGKLVFNLDAFDYWLYPNKNSINALVVYDIYKSQIVSEMGGHSTKLTSSSIYLPDKYTYPYFEIKDDLVFVSHPFNHSIQVYDKAGQLIEDVCMASQYIDQLQEPLGQNYDIQESINFHITAAHYGQINYHEGSELFSRLVFHSSPLYDNDGKLNMNNCDKTYSLILFNKNLEKISEIFLGNDALWVRALPTKTGYVVSGKCSNYAGEDFLRYNFKYDFKK